MWAAKAGTPRLIKAGAAITAQMMYEAVTGTAKPTTHTTSAVKIVVRSNDPPAYSMTIELNFSPSPVSVTVPTMSPAPAHVAAMARTPVEPAAKALVRLD